MAKITIIIQDKEGDQIQVESNPPAGELIKGIRNGYTPTRAEGLAASFFVDCLKVHQATKAGEKQSGLIFPHKR